MVDIKLECFEQSTISAKLSDLAEIPYSILEKELAKYERGTKNYRKLQAAMNLRTMRGMSNNPHGMFGYKNKDF